MRRGAIRADAYKKLASLAVQNDPLVLSARGRDFIQTLVGNSPKTGLQAPTMSLKDLEMLLALCSACGPAMNFPNQAEVLLENFRAHLVHLPTQTFSAAVFDAVAPTPPWLLVAERLTAALAALAHVFERRFAPRVADVFCDLLDALFLASALDLSHYLTLQGLLRALAQNPAFFASCDRAFKVFYLLDSCIDAEDFLNGVEASSARYTSHLYQPAFMQHESVVLLSPISFLHALSQVMAAVTGDILGLNSKGTFLMEPLLARIAADSSFLQKNGHKPNGNGFAGNGYANGSPHIDSLIASTDSLQLSQSSTLTPLQVDFIKTLSDAALKKLDFLDLGEDYIVYSTMTRLRLGYAAKAQLLLVLVCGALTDVVDLQTVKSIFHHSLGIHDIMLDPTLGATVIQMGSLLVFRDASVGLALTRAFTSLVANPLLTVAECLAVSKSVGLASKVLSQDIVVTTIYALTNLLFVGNDGLQLQARLRRTTGLKSRVTLDLGALKKTNSVSSRLINQKPEGSFNEYEYQKVCQNAVTAISEVVAACGDESVSALAVAILSQKTLKLNTVVGPSLLDGLVACAPYLPEREFIVLVRLLHKLSLDAFDQKDDDLLNILKHARSKLAHKLDRQNPLYNLYLAEILLAIVSHGDVQELDHHRSHSEISAIGAQISLYLKPLADLLPDVHAGDKPLRVEDGHILYLFRNIWFNMVVHGYSINSVYAKTHAAELERIAYNTPPLASELSWNRTETSLELNTVLKRGLSNHNVKDHRHIVGDVFEVSRTISYSKLMFLASALFVESFRVKTGDCHKILAYYSDPSLKTSGIDKYLGAIAFKINKDYIELVNCGADKQFSAQNIADELTSMLIFCCSGVSDSQDAALRCSDLLVNKVPGSLCHASSLFALFDLLTLLYDSVVDSEINQYNPTFLFIAEKTGIQLKLPDSYTWRNETFHRFHDKARSWLKFLLLKCNHDTKSLIQAYVSEADRFQSNKKIRFGVSFALDMAGSITNTDRELINLSRSAKLTSFNLLPPVVSQLTWRSSFISEILDRVSPDSPESRQKALLHIREQVKALKKLVADVHAHVSLKEITDLLSEIAGYALVQDSNLAELVRYLVEIPFLVFKSDSMRAAASIWGAVMKERPNLSILVISEIMKNWENSVYLKQGIFCKAYDLVDPEFGKMEYSPSDFDNISKLAASVNKNFQPHSEIIKLLSSNFEATMNESDHYLKIFTRFVTIGLQGLIEGSLHPFARFVRFELIKFAFDVLTYHFRLGSRSCQRLTVLVFDSALSWFKARSSYPFGSNLLKIKADFNLLKDVAVLLSQTSTFQNPHLELKKKLLMLFMDDEISKIGVWLNSTAPVDSRGSYTSDHLGGDHITKAYNIDPQLAVNLAHRYKIKNLDELLQELIMQNPVPALPYPDAVQYFIGVNAGTRMPSYHLLFWEALSPIDAITLFLPPFGKNPFILQYTMRSLEHHDVNLTFFYVPQIVQSLRYDFKGYVQRFILETARVSRLFAHQIVWNMLANSYKDEDSTDPDPLKPTLDEIQEHMLANFSQEDLAFYEKEFGFFDEVTSISGKLKPYIKKLKAEKKIKIDEEMSKIQVQPGVYLPSNPDGVLVDINRKSGKPLQSHAKAPFMATFKIRKEVEVVDDYGDLRKKQIEKWQSAIFKVGDDCRQDVLALQLISVFRTIWQDAGLDLYVFPYRVTATAPGCGVIDVLPNSTSRDMLGREAVNGLYEYFITKFGPETSIEFQQARNNLIRSLAGYSIISYLLQFKDRHNGNIMYDEQGHVLHIDFGFCFDIVPGGVKFEVAPFKLTKEMVMVLGGSDDTQAFRWFEELCIKGFLACRPYMETIVRCVNPMLESGLPCFKDTTIKKLRKRFVPNKSEREAALHFKSLIKKAYESFYTTGYDEFQRLTNGIPY